MPIAISIADIADAFPKSRVALVIAEGLAITPARPPALDALIREREEAARARWAGIELAQIPGIAAWRSAYKAFGIKQTRYRSSVERLVKNVLAGRELGRINAFVDLYNAVSLAHVLPLGADDLDHVVPPLAFRYARDDDSFVDMSDASEEGGAEPEAPKPGEVVYADAMKVLCRRWNWRQVRRRTLPHGAA
jgi:DNA/RNA-binding domain of Phe-tRNA-synthetase-like protein